MSFEVHDLDAQSVKLQSAILLYGSTKTYGNLRYATIHPVDSAGRDAPPVIRAGRPLDGRSLQSVCADLMESARVRSGVLPATVLSVGLEHVVWWSPPGRRTYFFNTSVADDGRVYVGQRNGMALTPGLVFVAKRQQMMVFAVQGDERPDADTRLCHAPLMNVYEDGKVCTGSMPLPDTTVAASIAKWEEAFWNSNFTHPNHAKPVSYTGGLHAFSLALLDGRFRKFPQRVLRPIKGLTLGTLVDQLDRLRD